MIDKNTYPSERALMDFILNKSLPIKKVIYNRELAGLTLEMDCEEGDWRDEFETLLKKCYPTLVVKTNYREKQAERAAYTEDEIYNFLKASITASDAWLERDCFVMKESRITLHVPNATVEKTVLSMHIESRLEEITGRRYFLECACPDGDCELKALDELIESEESVFSDGIKIEAPVAK